MARRAGSGAGRRRGGRARPTASTIVCCGASLSITATSPNWRSASTRTTGLSVRRARTTARLVAITDLPAPPLVEKTVMTWPSSPSSTADVGASGRADGGERCRRPAGPPRPGALVSTGAASTSLTPARSAWRNSSVVSSAAMRMAPTSGWSAMRRSASARPVGRGARRAEDDDHGAPLRRSRRASSEPTGTRQLAELHGQAAAHRLVGVDDDRSAGRRRVGAGAARRVPVGLAEVEVEA